MQFSLKDSLLLFTELFFHSDYTTCRVGDAIAMLLEFYLNEIPPTLATIATPVATVAW